MAHLDRFSLILDMGYDVPQNTGQTIAFRERRRILLDRPNGLRAEALRSDGDEAKLFFDGTTMVLLNTRKNVYARLEHPGDLDSLVRYAVDDLGIRVPLAWMLLSTLPRELERLTLQVDHVERDVLDFPPTHHLAGRTANIDFQFWIGPDQLPRRVILSYRNEPGQPQFWAEFSDTATHVYHETVYVHTSLYS